MKHRNAKNLFLCLCLLVLIAVIFPAVFAGCEIDVQDSGLQAWEENGNNSKGTTKKPDPTEEISRKLPTADINEATEPTEKPIEPTTGGNRSNTAFTPQEIAKLCTPAVFYIEIYDQYGSNLGSGSGFFLTDDGVAVTNYHVMNGSYSAKIKMTSEEWYTVLGYYYLSAEDDIAVIKIGSPAGVKFPVLKMGEPEKIEQGESVYAIGSPFGLDNTFTNGLISNTNREEFIQHTAPISAGNSGGALINSYGEVIGINTAVIETFGDRIGQNLNLAVPISKIDVDSFRYYSPSSLADAPWINYNQEGSSGANGELTLDDVAYKNYPHVPDFGLLYGEIYGNYILDFDESAEVDEENYPIYMYGYLVDTSDYDITDFKADYDYVLEQFGFERVNEWTWEEYDYGYGSEFKNSDGAYMRYNWFDNEVWIGVYY